MRGLRFLNSKRVLIGLSLVLALAAAFWFQRKPLLAWYYLRGLASASEGERDRWVRRVVSLDDAAVPGLLDLLRHADPVACANSRAALSSLAQQWGKVRATALADRMSTAFPSLSLPGRLRVLELQATLVTRRQTGPASVGQLQLVQAGGRLLRIAQQQPDSDIQAGALSLAESLVEADPPAEVLAAIHDQARLGLASPNARCRALALQLTRSRPLTNETDLLELVVPLLRDPSAEVRREALQAVGLKDRLISADDLLTWLHDPDGEVRQWCEKALLGRGLSGTDIMLGRLITAPKAQERLKIFAYLRRGAVKDPGTWLLRLFDDPERAVRIAAARAAVELRVTGMAERLQELVQNDRDQTVREVAEFWYRNRASAR
jgi:HEAT repeat protein